MFSEDRVNRVGQPELYRICDKLTFWTVVNTGCIIGLIIIVIILAIQV